MKKMITAKAFCDAWRKVWNRKSEKMSSAFAVSSWGEWTKLILTTESGFLHEVKCEIENVVSREFIYWCEEIFRTDVAFVTKGGPYFMNTYGEDTMPLFVDVLIEHESQFQTTHDEMWKLIFYRSPLKVIVTYAHPDEWKTKLEELLKFLYLANEAFPENPDTRYLFIVGPRAGKEMRWRWASDEQHKLQDLC